jgi:hypothetical protein
MAKGVMLCEPITVCMKGLYSTKHLPVTCVEYALYWHREIQAVQSRATLDQAFLSLWKICPRKSIRQPWITTTDGVSGACLLYVQDRIR